MCNACKSLKHRAQAGRSACKRATGGLLNQNCSSRARLLGHSSNLPCAALHESQRSCGSCCFPSLPRKCGKSRRTRACHWQIAPPPSARPSVAAGRPASAAAAAASCSSVPTPVHMWPADELCARLGRPAAPAAQAGKCCACSAGRGGLHRTAQTNVH